MKERAEDYGTRALSGQLTHEELLDNCHEALKALEALTGEPRRGKAREAMMLHGIHCQGRMMDNIAALRRIVECKHESVWTFRDNPNTGVVRVCVFCEAML